MKLIAQKILTLSRKRLGFIYTNYLKLLNILLKVQPDNYDLMRGSFTALYIQGISSVSHYVVYDVDKIPSAVARWRELRNDSMTWSIEKPFHCYSYLKGMTLSVTIGKHRTHSFE